MTYGITGNPLKDELWDAAATLASWMMGQDISFYLPANIAEGLQQRELLDPSVCEEHSDDGLADKVDVVLSFGGDGTMLRSAHEVGPHGTPILGVNIGRLGFLADIEVGDLKDAIRQLEDGKYRVEPRMVLEAQLDKPPVEEKKWALNELVIDRSGPAGLISIDVVVDEEPLNTYWADGLIISTPTGSTAYSMAAGGPIVAPGSDVVILVPVASHSLTVRPLVLPASSVIEVRVETGRNPYVLAADGESSIIEEDFLKITISRASHTVNLVKLPEQHYFHTIRSKLMWGAQNRR